jgi:hypothetical protein
MAPDTGERILCFDRPFVSRHANCCVWYQICATSVVAKNIGLCSASLHFLFGYQKLIKYMVEYQNFNRICIERDYGWAGDQWCTGVQLGVWDTVS